MIDKHGATPLLLNGQSASYIGQEKYDEAEAALQEAVEKDPNNVDTLINLIVLAQQTGKSNEVISLRNQGIIKCNHLVARVMERFLTRPSQAKAAFKYY